MKRRALITGISGQVGAYLAEFLLARDYEVHGMIRRASNDSAERIEHLRDRLHLHQGDLLDQLSLVHVIQNSQPHEVYNLAAQSLVPASLEHPPATREAC